MELLELIDHRTNFLKLDCNLKKLSLLKVAALLWEIPAIKDEILKYGFEVNEENTNRNPKLKKWKKIVQMVNSFAEKLHLPTPLLKELQSILILTGKKYFAWFNHVIEDQVFDIYSMPKITWTSYGTINEAQIKKEVMMNSERPNYYWLEENISSLEDLVWYIVTTNIIDINYVDSILKKLKKKYRRNLSYAHIFLCCIKAGHVHHADYFYRKNFILTQKVLNSILKSSEDDNIFENRLKPSILLYILKKTLRCQIEDFFTVFSIFFMSWSHVELSTKMLTFSQELNFTNDFYLKVLKLVIHFIQNFPKNEVHAYNYIYQPVLANILTKIPKEVKVNFFQDYENRSVMAEFFNQSKFSILETIINDPGLEQLRCHLILGTTPSFQFELIKNTRNYFGVSINFMRLLKVSDEEKREILRSGNDTLILRRLLTEGYFSKAEGYAEWYSYLKGEIVTLNEMKELVDPSDVIFLYSLRCQYDLLQKYLKWQYDLDTDKEIKKIKSEIFSHEFINQTFWKQWMTLRSGSRSKISTSNILNYFLISQNKLRLFKRRIVENPEFISTLLDLDFTYLDLTNKVINLNAVFKYFKIKTKKVNEIKNIIKCNISWWLDVYWNKFVFLNEIITWISNNTSERNEIIKDYLNSSKGPLFCFNILNVANSDDRPEGRLQKAANVLLAEWIYPHGDIIRIKNGIRELGLNSAVNKNDVVRVLGIFD